MGKEKQPFATIESLTMRKEERTVYEYMSQPPKHAPHNPQHQGRPAAVEK
jgi:hypothetical protein